MIRRTALVFALLAGAAVLLALPAGASHSWGSYHWARTANPFTLKLGDNVSSQWDSILATTSGDWSQSTVLDTTIVTGQAGNTKRCRATSGRVEVCNASYGNNGWLGVAQIWASGSHITQGIVKLNDYYFNQPQYNSTAWRNLVSCQEVGHTLGLDHQDESFTNANLGTCMDYTSDPSTNQHPNKHDYDQLVTIYSHLDSSTTIQSTTADTPGPPQRVGNSDLLWVQDLGNGRRLFTFVTWVDGTKRHGPPDTG